MANVPVEAIRTSNRYDLTLNRKKLKHEETDLRRSLANMGLSDVDLSEIANKLKHKSSVSVRDLQILKNLLIQDEANIKLILNTHGAVRGIVRELTGSDETRQVEAAGCLCNLALADLRGCLALIKAAGAYLVAALDSQNIQLAITCAWTLGNLSGSGLQAAHRVTSLGAVRALCRQMAGEQERKEPAVYALTLIAHAMGDQLSPSHMDAMCRCVAGQSCDSTFRLLYIMSCHPAFRDPSDLIQRHLIQRFPHLMRVHHEKCIVYDCCELVYAIRTLANMERGSAYYHFLRHIHGRADWRRDFFDLITDRRLRVSMLWLYGNMGWRNDPEHFIEHFNFAAAHLAPPPNIPDLPLREGFHIFEIEEPSLSDELLEMFPPPERNEPLDDDDDDDDDD